MLEVVYGLLSIEQNLLNLLIYIYIRNSMKTPKYGDKCFSVYASTAGNDSISFFLPINYEKSVFFYDQRVAK